MTGYQACMAIGALLLVGMAMLHILLIFGFPLGELVLGGQHKVIPGNLRYRNGIFAVVFVAVAALYLEIAGLLTFNIPVTFLNAAITVFLLFLVGATIFNFAITKSLKEKWIMGPLTVLIGLSGLLAVLRG